MGGCSLPSNTIFLVLPGVSKQNVNPGSNLYSPPVWQTDWQKKRLSITTVCNSCIWCSLIIKYSCPLSNDFRTGSSCRLHYQTTHPSMKLISMASMHMQYLSSGRKETNLLHSVSSSEQCHLHDKIPECYVQSATAAKCFLYYYNHTQSLHADANINSFRCGPANSCFWINNN